MIIDDIADMVAELHKTMPATKVARIFDKERKWVYSIECGCAPRLDYALIAGLNQLGYELKLVPIKKGGVQE